jgi:thiamine-monophosphate kinase
MSFSPFTSSHRGSIAALGEEALIARIRKWLGKVAPASPRGIGDDCAVVAPSSRRQLVKVDPVVYGRHFDANVAPEAAGAKLLKRNLSDFAAMGGGRPTAALLSLAVDRRTSVLWLERFHRGLAAAALRYRVPVVGGAVCEVRGTVFASLSLLGDALSSKPTTRTGARKGDRICVTGHLGNSLRSGHHLRFEPRLAEGTWLGRRADVHAMIDVSDGLAKDVRALTPSGTEPAIDATALPIRRGADLKSALCEGEDYELLFALSSRTDWNRFTAAWKKRFPKTRLSCLGTFVPRGRRAAGKVDLRRLRGYEHLGAR